MDMRMNATPPAGAFDRYRSEPVAGANPPPSTLVVYFSRRGHTRQVARLIAEQCGADTEEIFDGVDRRGILGYLRSLVEALLRLPVPIQPSRCSPRAYDTVIIGTPVWAWQIASPVRTYLCRHRGRFRRVAFFCCHRGWGPGAVLQDTARLCARPATATLALSDREVAQGRHRSSLSHFVRAVRAARRSRRTEDRRQAA
jgi:flavodoxin